MLMLPELKKMLNPLFSVNGRSMMPGFPDGAEIVVNRFAYALGKPEPGDVVVMKHPFENRDILKRVSKVDGEKLFVLGDSLENSADSRDFGWVDRKLVLGKVV